MSDHTEAVSARKEQVESAMEADKAEHLRRLEAELNRASELREKALHDKLAQIAGNHSESVQEKQEEIRKLQAAEHELHLATLEQKMKDAEARRLKALEEKSKLAAAMGQHTESVQATREEELHAEHLQSELEEKHYKEQLDHAKKNHEAILAGEKLKAMFMAHTDHPENQFPDKA